MNTGTERTTDLDTIRNYPHRFTWGRVDKIHEVGAYTIVEYQPRIAGSREMQEETSHRFHIYVDGKDKSEGSHTLEGALIIAIAHKRLERNEGRFMAMAACKLLGIE